MIRSCRRRSYTESPRVSPCEPGELRAGCVELGVTAEPFCATGNLPSLIVFAATAAPGRPVAGKPLRQTLTNYTDGTVPPGRVFALSVDPTRLPSPEDPTK